MRKTLLTLCLLAPLFSSPSRLLAEGGVVLPAQIEIERGRIALVAVQSKGEVVRWVNAHPNLDLLDFESGKRIVVSSPVEGVYPIFAYTAVDGVPTPPAKCTVVVKAPPGPVPPPPVPPGPGPGPGPAPVDPMLKEVRDLVEKEPGQLDSKWRQAGALINLYREGAVLIRDPNILTPEHFSNTLSERAKSLGVEGGTLVELRKYVSKKFNEAMGLPTMALTDERRRAGALLFERLCRALEGAMK